MTREPVHNSTIGVAAQTEPENEKAIMKAKADRQLNAARFYLEKSNHIAAINSYGIPDLAFGFLL